MKYLLVTVLSILAASLTSTARDLSLPKLQIKGAKVAMESDAKRIAFDHYVKKMKMNVLANESVKEISIIKLGYSIHNFAAKGDFIWEARILTLEGELRAVIWVHPDTEKVFFVSGPWEGGIGGVSQQQTTNQTNIGSK